MSLADLVQALERDAAQQIRVLLDTAAASAAQLEARAARQRDDTSTHALDTWRAACRAQADDREATARRAARARVLVARATMLERVHAALLAMLPDYASQTRQALRRAALACTTDPAASVQDVATGVVIELPTGTEIVATLEALVDREWPRLAAAIVARVGSEVTS